jgi:hypothetical protein
MVLRLVIAFATMKIPMKQLVILAAASLGIKPHKLVNLAIATLLSLHRIP